MESLRKKEAELKFINDAVTSNDSISLLVLTSLKQTLGENANIKVEKGAVIVIMDHSSLFGTNAGNTKIEGGSVELLEKIAGVIKSNPDMAVTLEFHTDDTNSWEMCMHKLPLLPLPLEILLKSRPNASRSQESPIWQIICILDSTLISIHST
jgi:hypothetical protein